MVKIENLVVQENQEVEKNLFRLKLTKGSLAPPQIGQFYLFKTEGMTLRRPISIHLYDGESLFFYYAVKGDGTRKIANLKEGQTLSVQGPLGNGFPEYSQKKILLVAGGMGLAPFLYVVKKLAMSNALTLVAGAASSKELKILSSFEPYQIEIIIASEDGSVGVQGNVLTVLKELLAKKRFDVAFSCGPEPMLKALSRQLPDIPHLVSLERNMACGTGACMGCSIKTKSGMKKVCQDGPVFDDKEVFYE